VYAKLLSPEALFLGQNAPQNTCHPRYAHTRWGILQYSHSVEPWEGEEENETQRARENKGKTV